MVPWPQFEKQRSGVARVSQTSVPLQIAWHFAKIQIPIKVVDFKASVGRPLGSRSQTSCLQHRVNGYEPKASWPAHERVRK